MKKFTSFKDLVVELNTLQGKAPSEVSKAKEKLSKDKDQFKDKQEHELDVARERDFERRQRERAEKRDQQKRERKIGAGTNESVNEVLEIGTDEIVKAYKDVVPGQNDLKK